MTLPIPVAHQRYLQQASWTAQLRRHIFTRAGLPNARRILEIGCGTGAVLSTIVHSSRTQLFGLDIDSESLHLAEQNAPVAHLLAGDGQQLPIANHSFDISFFHFVLLWLADPVRALTEARRATRPGGAVIAFAEPDYSQRVSLSATMTKLGGMQIESLRATGAEPTLGGRLPQLFAAAGITPEESGKLDPFEQPSPAKEMELELQILENDLKPFISPADLVAAMAELQKSSDLAIFNVPTFYCWGRVP